MDTIGFVFITLFVSVVTYFIAYGLLSWLILEITTGKIGERGILGAGSGSAALVLLYLLYRFYPKLLFALSFLVNYKIDISGRCRVCGAEYQFAHYPKSNEPF